MRTTSSRAASWPHSDEILLDAERVAEVGGQAEVLLRRVVAVDGGQLLGSQDGERLEELGADGVLAPVAAGEGEDGGADALAAGQPHQHPVVLVVRVRGDVEDAGVTPIRRSARPSPLAPRSCGIGASCAAAGAAVTTSHRPAAVPHAFNPLRMDSPTPARILVSRP